MSTAVLMDADADAGRLPQPTSSILPMKTDEALYEWLNGRRVEMPPMSVRASIVAGRLHVTLNAFAAPVGLGEAFIETLIRLPVPQDHERNRRPDLCFVSAARLKQATPGDPDVNAWAVIPDLAIEVTSPTDRAEDQREKVLEYLHLGVRCVWVVYPRWAWSTSTSRSRPPERLDRAASCLATRSCRGWKSISPTSSARSVPHPVEKP